MYLQCAKVADKKSSSLLHWAWHSEGNQFLVGGAWIEDLAKERLHGRAGMLHQKFLCINMHPSVNMFLNRPTFGGDY